MFDHSRLSFSLRAERDLENDLDIILFLLEHACSVNSTANKVVNEANFCDITDCFIRFTINGRRAIE